MEDQDRVPSTTGDSEPSTSEAVNQVAVALQRTGLQGASPVQYKRQVKEKYAFWETQPVAQFKEGNTEGDGPIDKPKTVADVRQEPYNLPESFEWCTCDFKDDKVVHEVYELLSNNYVEDDDNMFRFNYSPAFLKWALQCPGFKLDWLLGVRVKTNHKLVGFISGIPAGVQVNGTRIHLVEINFLCVHKKLRSKRLAPVLIKEITRRVNLHGIWQAAYTAGVLIPKPFATCRYWHRNLNPRKLIDVGFSRLQPRMTMARTIKLYKLPDEPATPGLVPFDATQHASQVTQLLNDYLAGFKVAPVFTEEEVRHWFQPQELVIDTFVVEGPGGRVTDMLSFYTLPSLILGHPEHTDLRAAYMYYTVARTVPVMQLMNDALILAKNKGYDVFNALDLLQNEEFLKELKFGIGDGQLHYYLYNWRVAQSLKPSDVGLILM